MSGVERQYRSLDNLENVDESEVGVDVIGVSNGADLFCAFTVPKLMDPRERTVLEGDK